MMCIKLEFRAHVVVLSIVLLALGAVGDDAKGQDQNRLTTAFRRVDANRDGSLSVDEVNRFPQLTTRLRGADRDGDGTLSFDEFRTHLVRQVMAPQPKTGKLGPGDHVREIAVGDVQRRYRVYVPESYRSGRATPAVIAYHGGGGNPESMVRLSGLNEKAEEAGFLVVYPYGSGRDPDRSLTFNAGRVGGYAKQQNIDDVGFTRAILDDLKTAVTLDPDRIYATGISNGAMMAYRVASELSDRIAAIAPVAGPMGIESCDPERPVPVLHFHGTDDELAPFQGGRGKGSSNVPAIFRPEFLSVDFSIQCWVEANGCDPEPKVEELPDRADDGMSVVRKTWGNGRGGAEVVLIEIRGGGHTWPGREPPVAFLGESTRDIAANDLIWEFFQKHPRTRPTSPSAPTTAPEVQANVDAEVDADSALAFEPGRPKPMLEGDAARDAAGLGQWFESIHVPGITDFREGTNGFVLADLDGNGYLDVLAISTPPFALDETWNDNDGDVDRTRDPRDRLRILLNRGGFDFEPRAVTLLGSAATPEDFGQGWRGSQIPAMADFDGDGYLDLFVSRQCPMSNGRVRAGMTPVGCSLFLSDGAFDRFRDRSRDFGALNELAYNRQVSLGDVDQDGFIDVALGADNVVSAFEGLPRSALFVFRPNDGRFEGGRFEDIGGTDLIPDFGGFAHDATRDKAGPNLALRDMDNDGDLDLLQSTHVLINGRFPRNLPYSPATYRQGVFTWKNLLAETGEFRFEKSTDNGLAVEGRLRFDERERRFVPEGDARAPGLAYLFCGDVDNDGLFDVIGVDGSDPTFTPKPEDVGGRFWRNRGGFRFEESTVEAGLGSLNDNYGDWYRFFEAEIPPPLTRPVNLRAFRVTQPGLEPTRPIDLRPYHSDVIFADFDNDTWLDMVVLDRREPKAIETRALFYRNQGGGVFEPVPTTVSGLDGTGISGEAADLNNDGLVDLYIAGDPDNTGQADDLRRFEDKVYLNTGQQGARENHWLRLRFSGVRHARLLGARVEIFEPGTTDRLGTRGIYSHHTYKSGGPFEAHFGLGSATRVDLTVSLPGGKTVTFEGLEGDRFLDLNLDGGTISEVSSGVSPSSASASGDHPGYSEVFTKLREETFACGGQTHTVAIYRCNPFAEALGLEADQTDVACEFVLVPGGRFTMGSTPEVLEAMVAARSVRSRLQDELPPHDVDVPSFLMARTEVTKDLWRRLAGLADLPNDPSFFANADGRAPVEMVSWNQTRRWLEAINEAHGLSLRLPTEAEWEYACRAGTETPIYNGPMTILGRCNCPELGEIAWYMGNCGVDYAGAVNSTRWPQKQEDHRRAGVLPIAQKQANAFGLYDMLGNVMEWCQDHAHASYEGAPTNGSAWLGGDWIPGSPTNGPLSRDQSFVTTRDGPDVPGRIRRGGSWRNFAYNTRSAMRSTRGPNFTDSNQGFRVAAPIPTDR